MRRINGYRCLAAGVGALLLAGSAFAQDENEGELSGIGIGPGLRLHPSLGTRASFTDNRFRSSSDEESETGLRFDPALILSYTPSSASYDLGYRGRIDPVVEDNYEDREFFFAGDARPLTRHRFELDARHKHGHDELGANRTQGAADPDSLKLDEWDDASVNGEYTFGASEARINVSLRGGLSDREYTTNRALTRFLDYQSTLVGGGATYRVGPKTQLVLDLEHQDFEYDHDFNPSFDSTIERALVGVRWLATAKTNGEVLVGYYERDFDLAQREDSNGVDWRARVIWNPVTRTRLTFTTGRVLRETFLLGESFINEQLYQVDWRQDWTSRLYSSLTVAQNETDYEGTSRSDNATTVGVVLFFELSRNVSVNGGFQYATRDSSDPLRDFDRNVLFQGFEFVF